MLGKTASNLNKFTVGNLPDVIHISISSFLALSDNTGWCLFFETYLREILTQIIWYLITDNTRISITACDTVPRFFNRTMLGFATAVTEESKINMPITLLWIKWRLLKKGMCFTEVCYKIVAKNGLQPHFQFSVCKQWSPASI